MIQDKVLDFLYERAAPLFTAARFFCFSGSVFWITDSFSLVWDFEFWASSSSDAGARFLDVFFSISVAEFLLLLISSFLAVPILVRWILLMLSRREVSRIAYKDCLRDIHDSVSDLNADQVKVAVRDAYPKAALAERKIKRVIDITEVYAFSLLFFFYEFLAGRSGGAFTFLLIPFPLVVYLLVQRLLFFYARHIYYCKCVAARFAKFRI
ncbi:hypothetical protein [Pseudomonas flexibilis]|uniref:Uncharacterized protein n=1 Tax=Pseudomonas flexibilis TaxID=706570 RepID=A0A1N6UHX8_9PSED|nr:hypothetical protein [Pseudomonas flexibilis]SIQ64936.1 hypothetical protein SAMN05421672_108145 [Pseudomonas flexibilis]